MQTSQLFPLFSRPVTILGSGHALPERIVTSAELDAELGLEVGSVERISGVVQRHFASTTETAASLGAIAASHALCAAGLSALPGNSRHTIGRPAGPARAKYSAVARTRPTARL